MYFAKKCATWSKATFLFYYPLKLLKSSPLSLETWVSEGFLQRPIVDFSRHSQKYFSRGDKSGKISIYPLETKKTAFFAKHLIGKCQISNSREGFGPSHVPTFLRPWLEMHQTRSSVPAMIQICHSKLNFRTMDFLNTAAVFEGTIFVFNHFLFVVCNFCI